MTHDSLFRRGYLISESNIDRSIPSDLANWKKRSLNEFDVYSCPSLEFETIQTQNNSFTLLGTVIDPINEISSTSIILERLYNAISDGKEEFLDYLDALSGRFILFVNFDRSLFCVQDATGTKSLFYECVTEDHILSSHAEIISMMGDYDMMNGAKEIIASDASCFPALSTYYQGIQQLTPNTLLYLEQEEIERIFPREPLERRPITTDLIDEIAELLTNQIELLLRDNEIVLSLSAGIDSRLSLAATKEFSDEIDYYSWVFPDDDGTDAKVAQKICSHIGIDHNIYHMNERPDPEFQNMFQRHTSNMAKGYDRVHSVYNHGNNFPTGKLEVRSNVAEVARTYYHKKFALLPEKADENMFTKLYGHVFSPSVRAEFKEYIESTSFQKPYIYNYDPYDLFYWEYKMGNWLMQWLLEKDISHDNFIFYNNRELLKKMLSIDRVHRKNDEIFYRVIENIWPECLDIPINPQKKQPPWYKNEVKRFSYGMAIRQPMPIYKRIIKFHRS